MAFQGRSRSDVTARADFELFIEGSSIFCSGLAGFLKLPVKHEINYAPLALRKRIATRALHSR